MNKKVLVVLLVLSLAVTGLFAKDLGIKVGGQLGWGFDNLKMKSSDGSALGFKNRGFEFNLTGEYDFDQNWGVRANLGMMFAGETFYGTKGPKGWNWYFLDEKSDFYIDFAVDAKYGYAIDDKLSVAGLAGLELVAGKLCNGYDSLPDSLALADNSDLYNVAFGLNGAVEMTYEITDNISIIEGVSASWLFVNNAKFFEVYREEAEETGKKLSVNSFYIRPYVGATYAF